VNFGHLHLGTKQGNLTEMVERGRQAVGERNKRTILLEHDVPIIRALSARKTPTADIALAFGVAHGTIRALLTGKTWRHVP
jgi:hypothetical protein